MRIEKQKYSDRFPYDEGYALIDATGNQCGWFKDRERAEDRLKQESVYESLANLGV